jgi:hypothetical protein
MRFGFFINSKPKARRKTVRTSGFSVMELVVSVAVIGLLATVAVHMMGGIPSSVKNRKLESDVVMLNQLVGLYLSDGGSLSGASTPQAVIDKLKRVRTATDVRQHAGNVSGRLVDIRLRARTGSGALPPGVTGRARWNAAKRRFEITSGSGSGVDEFYLDEALSDTNFGTEVRSNSGRKRFNSTGLGWVWGNTTDPGFAYSNPTYVNPNGNEDYFNPEQLNPGTTTGSSSGSTGTTTTGSGTATGSGSGSGSGTTSGSGTSTTTGSGSGPPPAVVLPNPSLTPPGGTFAGGSLPSTVTINRNGAHPSKSKIQYQINSSGIWIDYSTPVAITSGMTLAARNLSLDSLEFIDSGNVTGTYYELVSGFAGGGVGSWSNAAGGSNLVQTMTNGNPTSIFEHGNTQLDLGGGVFLDAGVKNTLTFTKTDFTGATPNTWFSLGNLQMLNGNTFNQSEATSATLALNLNLTNPASSGVVNIDFGFVSTENSSDQLASADIVELRSPLTNFTVDIGGVTYRLELSWETLNPGTGVVDGNNFLIYEGATAQARLRARFVPNR